MFAWIRALHIRERYLRQYAQEREELHERQHRLEMRHRELTDRLDHLEELLERERNRRTGARGGRPAKSEQPSLEQIPHGDKVALRRALGVVK